MNGVPDHLGCFGLGVPGNEIHFHILYHVQAPKGGEPEQAVCLHAV